MAKKKTRSIKPLPGYPQYKKFQTMEEVNDYFDRDRLTCLVCGHTYISLHAHLNNTHQIRADQYREMYAIPWGRGLISKPLKEKQAAIMNKQREEGILPPGPTPEHIAHIQEAAKKRRSQAKAVTDSQTRHALKTHGRKEKWSKKDFEEYLRRIKTGRTITEVGKDKDMPCREVFDTYRRGNEAFQKKFEKIWDKVPFPVQVRGQKTGERFKRKVVKLRLKEHSWPEIGRRMEVSTGTVRNTWFRLKQKGELKSYIKELKKTI